VWHTLRISIRENRSPGCLRIVARHVIAAHAVLPRAASVSRSSCSYKSTTRAIRARPGRSPPIWSPSMVHGAANREPPRRNRRLLRLAHHGPRSVRPRRCRSIRSERCVTEAPPFCSDGCRIELRVGRIHEVRPRSSDAIAVHRLATLYLVQARANALTHLSMGSRCFFFARKSHNYSCHGKRAGTKSPDIGHRGYRIGCRQSSTCSAR